MCFELRTPLIILSKICFWVLCLVITSCNKTIDDPVREYHLSLESSDTVYDNNTHSAFTGLVSHKGKLYLSFREGNAHRPATSADYGVIKILVNNGTSWTESAVIKDENKDLRDPFLIEMEGKLRVYIGYNTFEGDRYQHSGTVYSDFDGNRWSEVKPVTHDVPHIVWLWKVRFFDEIYYSVAYLEGEKPALLSSTDGINWKTVTLFNLEGVLSEADMGFVGNTMYVCLRKDQPVGSRSWWGVSKYPFDSFSWTEMTSCIESPELARLPYSNLLLLAGRERVQDSETVNVSLFSATPEGELNRISTLLSEDGGDRGYPGMAVVGNKLYCSYYSGDENHARIILSLFGIDII